MTQTTPDKSELVKWKLKIDNDIKEEDMYIIMSTTEISLSRIDNHLRHDVGINENEKSQKDLKEEIIGEVEFFFSAKHKNTTNTKCDPTVSTARCNDATISSTVPTNGATDTTTTGLKLKWNIKVYKKKRPNNNLKNKFNKKQGIPSTIQPYKIK